MISKLLLTLCFVLLAHTAWADAVSQRLTPGMSLSLQGELLDLNAPICTPAAGSYSVQYRNSIATGCSGRGSDDFATLVFTGGSAATYTMPQSKVSTFTGSISGTTLTTPANAVVIGSVITGVGVLDNTYVTAGSGTSWTVNNSQTVASETLTQAVYPPGHGTCFKNTGNAVQTLTATTSTVYGAPGAASTGPVALLPGGEACLQADTTGNYVVSGYLPGIWTQSANNTSPNIQWTGLSGFSNYRLSCTGIYPAASSSVYVQIGEGATPTWETSGYEWGAMYTNGGGVNAAGNSSDAGFEPSTGAVNNTTTDSVFFESTLYGFLASTLNMSITWNTIVSQFSIVGSGQYLADTNPATAVRMTTNAATNLQSGTCSLSGISQ